MKKINLILVFLLSISVFAVGLRDKNNHHLIPQSIIGVEAFNCDNSFKTTYSNSSFNQAPIAVMDPQNPIVLEVCDDDFDGITSFDFQEIIEFLNDEYDTNTPEEDVIYIAKSYSGLIKIENVSTNPTIVNVCGTSRNLYEVAVDQNQDVYVSSREGVFRVNTDNCNYQNLGSLPNNANIAMSFDTQNNLYVGGRDAKVYRADAGQFTSFYEWNDFGSGQSGGDFVVIGDFMYIAWALGNNNYLYKVTLDNDNQFVSYENLGQIADDTYGMAAENGRLYGVTPEFLYEIDLETIDMTTIIQNPSSVPWWGAAGLHEALSYSYTFHESYTDAESGDNALGDTFENTTPFEQEIFIRIVEEYSGDVEIVNIQLIVNTPPETEETTLFGCSTTGNFGVFDLSEALPEMIADIANIDVEFYETQSDAVDEVNAIQNPNSYQSQDTTQTIVVRFQDGECITYNTITLQNDASSLDLPDTLYFCSDSNITISVPNNFDSYVWEGLQNSDLDNNNPNSNEITVTNPGSYTVTVTFGNNCSLTETVEVIEENAPSIGDHVLSYCSENESISLSTSEIINDLQDIAPTYSYVLYENISDAENQTNALSGNITLLDNQSLIVQTKENPNDACYSLSSLTIQTDIIPQFDWNEYYQICQGEAITISVPNGFNSYQWSGLQAVDEGANDIDSPQVTITQAGNYTLEVSNDNCMVTKELTIEYAESPIIQDIVIEGDAATIIAMGEQIEYSLDNQNWTRNPTFSGLDNGVYTAYIRSDNLCGIAQQEFTLFSITNVITPNADGYNDVWYVKGLSNYPGSTVQIYDRYGKLMEEHTLDNDFYWNGTYQGQRVGTGTYWYILHIADGRTYSGHITVKNF